MYIRTYYKMVAQEEVTADRQPLANTNTDMFKV